MTGENGIIKTSKSAQDNHAIQSKCEELNFELNTFIDKQLSKNDSISRAGSLDYFKSLGYSTEIQDGQYCITATLKNGKTQTYQIQEKIDGTQEVVIKANNDTIVGSNTNTIGESNITHKCIPGPMPTCTEPQVCTICGRVLNPALGHDFDGVEWTTKVEATCEKDGTAYRKCKRSGCDYIENKTITKLGHNYSSTYTIDVNATCESSGVKSRHCTRENCSAKTGEQTIDPLGHNWGNGWVTTRQATCQVDGTSQRTCQRCSTVESRNDGKGNHNWPSTPDLKSYIGHSYTCQNPGCTEVKGPEPHQWPTYLNGKTWNQYESGNQYLYKLHYHDCSVCGYRITGNHTDRSAKISYGNKDGSNHFKYYTCPDCLIIYKTEQEYHSTTGFTYKWNNNKSSPKHTKKCKASGCTYSGTESCNSSNPCMKKGAPIYNQVCSNCGYCKTCKKCH